MKKGMLKKCWTTRLCLCYLFKKDNYPIGFINIYIEDSYDFGNELHKELWHKGISNEAWKAVINQVKKDRLPFITTTHDKNNPRSDNVMKPLAWNIVIPIKNNNRQNICLYFYNVSVKSWRQNRFYIRNTEICTIIILSKTYNLVSTFYNSSIIICLHE